MDIAIVIRNRKDGSRKNVVVTVNDRDMVKDIGQKISIASGIPAEKLKLILCGSVLEEETPVQSLFLGPTTNILALVVDAVSSDSTSELNSVTESLSLTRSNTSQTGAFHVYCKDCKNVTKGKLRVMCTECRSIDVVVKREPDGWKDVMKSNQIAVECQNCEHPEAFARFIFKCVKCNEVSAALSQVRGNWESSQCVVCGDSPVSIFDLGCNHPICTDCFTQYAETSLKEGNFHFRQPFGYTLSCAFSRCEFCVLDVHHFRVLGEDLYKEYQRIATEKLVALDSTGVFCPFPDCGASFFWEDEDNRGRTLCPECGRLFCKNCKERSCICSQEEESKVMIQATTKKCPGCQVSTERNGGCAHMSCVHCKMHWCWVCVMPWREDCQWDHWFA